MNGDFEFYHLRYHIGRRKARLRMDGIYNVEVNSLRLTVKASGVWVKYANRLLLRGLGAASSNNAYIWSACL